MSTYAIKAKELDTKRGELAALFDSCRTPEGEWAEITSAQQKEFNDRNAEINKLSDEVKSLQVLDESYQKTQEAIKASARRGEAITNTFGGGAGGNQDEPRGEQKQFNSVKSLGEQFTEARGYLNRNNNGGARFAVDFSGVSMKSLLNASGEEAMKTTLTTSAGIAPYPPRMAEYIPFALRTPVVADLMPNQDTDAPSIIYVEITTFTNNAAATAEGATKPESAIQGTQRTVPMSKISTTLPVSEEQMDDVQGIRDLINGALTSMIRLEEDRELLSGSGSSNEMTGFYNKSGVNTAAYSGNRFSAALNAMKSVRTVGFAEPSGWVIHPTDWYTLSIEQDTTGRFILGNPGDMIDKRLWGIPVVETTGATAGTLLTGAFRDWAKIWRKMDLRIDAGYVNDNFAKNLETIRAEERLCVTIFRPSAFALLTGF